MHADVASWLRPLLLSCHLPSRKHPTLSVGFVHLILRSFQIYVSGLDPSPKRREEEGAAETVDISEGGRQKVGQFFLRGRNGKAPAEEEGRGG